MRFLKMRGLSVWWGGPGMPSGEQGAEHVAEIIAWGLLNVYTRSVPELPANSLAELNEAFVMLTGGVQPWPTRPDVASYGVAKPAAAVGVPGQQGAGDQERGECLRDSSVVRNRREQGLETVGERPTPVN
jgi:hypothetical protein